MNEVRLVPLALPSINQSYSCRFSHQQGGVFAKSGSEIGAGGTFGLLAVEAHLNPKGGPLSHGQ